MELQEGACSLDLCHRLSHVLIALGFVKLDDTESMLLPCAGE